MAGGDGRYDLRNGGRGNPKRQTAQRQKKSEIWSAATWRRFAFLGRCLPTPEKTARVRDLRASASDAPTTQSGARSAHSKSRNRPLKFSGWDFFGVWTFGIWGLRR